MACAPEVAPSPELLAISRNSSTLCDGITHVSTITAFALSLEETSFITSDASSSILRSSGYSDQEKCVRLLDAVKTQVKTDPAKFESFVGILSREPALSFYASMLTNTFDIESQKCMCSSPQSSPESSRSGICLPISESCSEYGKAMSDLTEILQSSNRALEKMLVAFEHMSYYMKNKTYITIVESEAYKAVNSVRTLFQLLAPHLNPVDCSLLSALVDASGSEKAMQRLKEYLSKSESLTLGKGSYVALVPDTLSRNGSTNLVPGDPRSNVKSTDPVADSSPVPVTARVDAVEVSWGTFRYISSLLCGVFGVPPFALPYDEVDSGSVVIKWTTTKKMVLHIQSTVLDDGDLKLLLQEKIVCIQVGTEYAVVVGSQDYWMATKLPVGRTTTTRQWPGQRTAPRGAVAASMAVFMMPHDRYASTTDTRPTLRQLIFLVTPSGKTIRIIESIATNWKVVGIHLALFPIGAYHPWEPEACCTEIMRMWLGGRGRQPANWATLVRVLRETGFYVLADDVEQVVPTLIEGGREGGGGEC